MARAASRLVIEGRVQGVGYRWWAVQAARQLGLAGWVRNRADGSVEALAIGPQAALDRFAEACRQGPAHAAVVDVRITPAQDDGSEGFAQKATL
jgi:acylphosphatase